MINNVLMIKYYNIETEETLILASRLRGDDSQRNNVYLVTFDQGKHALKEDKAEDYSCKHECELKFC